MYIKHQMIKTVQYVLTCTNAHVVTMIVTCVDLVKRRLTFCHMNKQPTINNELFSISHTLSHNI